jgi:hypothetical protein
VITIAGLDADGPAVGVGVRVGIGVKVSVGADGGRVGITEGAAGDKISSTDFVAVGRCHLTF